MNEISEETFLLAALAVGAVVLLLSKLRGVQPRPVSYSFAVEEAPTAVKVEKDDPVHRGAIDVHTTSEVAHHRSSEWLRKRIHLLRKEAIAKAVPIPNDPKRGVFVKVLCENGGKPMVWLRAITFPHYIVSVGIYCSKDVYPSVFRLAERVTLALKESGISNTVLHNTLPPLGD